MNVYVPVLKTFFFFIIGQKKKVFLFTLPQYKPFVNFSYDINFVVIKCDVNVYVPVLKTSLLFLSYESRWQH